MPNGLKWSKQNHRWVKDEQTEELYYDGFDPRSWGLLISYWRYYPDKFGDLLMSDAPKYDVELIQRLIMRAYARYDELFITGSRGTTKSFCTYTALKEMGILYPGVRRAYVTPTKEQGAQISDEVNQEIALEYDGLGDYWKESSNSKENYETVTECGSSISINAIRGGTCSGVTAEECAQSDKGRAFDHENFRRAILPSVRGDRKVMQQSDPFYPQEQKSYITSAGKTHNESYDYRVSILNKMRNGGNAFAIDIPSEVAVLSRIRKTNWRNDLKTKLTADEWLREMDSLWVGTTENPLIRDAVITESKNMLCMEERHCRKPDVFYIIGYDVSYADGARNAKCATAIVKCEKQDNSLKKSRYLKSLVYVFDNPPPATDAQQARHLKMLWRRFSIENGAPTYIAIDAAAYGKAVIERMHEDLQDGMPPMSCMNHEFPELEKANALPVLYAIRATTGLGGAHDSDAEMIRYAEMEFEQGNIRLLTSNVYQGVEEYKKLHNIREDSLDSMIARPYQKTREMVAQIGNLRKVATGFNLKEERVSKSIQRDMWSAFKYALRVAYILEHENMAAENRGTSSWAQELMQAEKNGFSVNDLCMPHAGRTGGLMRIGGNGL